MQGALSTKKMGADELRRAFVAFFEARGHLQLPSASLVPTDDPTLLFTGAGMVPLKQYFSGEMTPPAPRAVTVQKCFRTTDLEEIGDASHLTFFEMLGNFSFGDYFKQDACRWALELMTDELGFALERLFYTVQTEDDESYGIWRGLGIADEKIFRVEDNWWGPVSDTGPYGPCSEIYVFTGEQSELNALSAEIDITTDERFLEVYNLVFTQFNRKADGTSEPLARRNIDTGMGFERVLKLMHGVESPYETPVFVKIVSAIKRLSARDWTEGDSELTGALRVVADHLRSAVLIIGDGVRPDKTGREYILRRLIRRALLCSRRLEIPSAGIAEIVSAVIGSMQSAYPALQQQAEAISEVIAAEQAAFEQVLSRNIFELLDESASGDSSRTEITATEAFKLYDTYGIPIDITAEFATVHSLQLNRADYEEYVSARRSAAEQGAAQFKAAATEVYADLPPTEFLGYEQTVSSAKVCAVIVDGAHTTNAQAGSTAQLVFDQTPFYAERGGQLYDCGEVRGGDKLIARITDVQSPYGGVSVHRAEIEQGSISVGDTLTLAVDTERRQRLMRNHTATHLIHAALREYLGEHVQQAGSLVHPDYLRFDFRYDKPLTEDEIFALQAIVNAKIRSNLAVEVKHEPYQSAVAAGALAFFGERYDATKSVRTIKIDGAWSYELCGGTHMPATGGIGLFVITGQSSVGAGLRRLVAITGVQTEATVQTLQTVAGELQSPVTQLNERLRRLAKERDTYKQKLAEAEQRYLNMLDGGGSGAPSGAGQPAFTMNYDLKDGKSVSVEAHQLQAASMDMLRSVSDKLVGNLQDGVLVIFASLPEGGIKLVVRVSETLLAQSVHAGEIAREIAAAGGGKGGGSLRIGQGGIKSVAELSSLLTRESVTAILDKLYAAK